VTVIVRRVLMSALAFGLVTRQASAQSWSFDAREIALGGVGGTHNVAADMIDEQRPYRAIVLPFGLIQVFQNIDVFKPDSSSFDPVRAVELAASPLHYTFGRTSTNTEEAFVSAIRNATLSRDLNAYRGFMPANHVVAEGLAAPSFGGTIKLSKGPGGTFHGVYIGAGPYFSIRSTTDIDQQLTSILASDTDVFVPNAQMPITNGSETQLALAITGGYRGRFAFAPAFASGSSRNGLYVAANYNFLRGFRYDSFDVRVRLDTDRAGLLTPVLSPPPVAFTRTESTDGRGFAIDAGVGVVLDRWELGFGVNGIANRIDWNDATQSVFSLANLFSGNGNFVESPPLQSSTVRVELPVDYRGNIAYDAGAWAAVLEAGHGLGGGSLHAGYERRLVAIDLRGGIRYTFERWNPSGGIGFSLSRRVGLDLAAFSTTANIEQRRQLALAASVRINRGR
jgi:hypothetical protein